MGSSISKPQRIMPPHVSLWPDGPAIFESLNDDTLATVLEFVGDKSYKSFGGVNKQCKRVYISSDMTKETFLFGYGSLAAITNYFNGWNFYRKRFGLGVKVNDSYCDDWPKEAVGKGVVLYNRRDVLEWALEEKKKEVLKGICYAAAGEDRLDILNEVWNNIDDEDDKIYVFSRTILLNLDGHAAWNGKLDALKWLETKGLLFDKYMCANQAAGRGHLHIIQWLWEEKGLELRRVLYGYAARWGHLHVMKWLREKKVPWDYYDTFFRGALGGNFDVLQWLHDEGCPWHPSVRRLIHPSVVKPEVIDWLNANGYPDRFVLDMTLM